MVQRRGIVSRKARGIYEVVERGERVESGEIEPDVETRVTEFLEHIERQIGAAGGEFEATPVTGRQKGAEVDAA